MPRPSPKCSLELSQDIPTSTICDWWKLIHAGWRHPLDYLHGGIICAPRECLKELTFLHKVGTIVHETTINPEEFNKCPQTEASKNA